MAAAECSRGRRRFAVACGVLSRCVRAEAAAAAGKMAAATPLPVPCPPAQAAVATMLLMPGADVAPHDVVREDDEAAPAKAQAQLTIMYGGRVLVFDGVPADRAAALVRVAAVQQDVRGGMVADVPVERKASLQRFMEKRRERLHARAPY